MDEQLDKLTFYMVSYITTIILYLVALILGPFILLFECFIRRLNKYYHTYNRVDMDDMPTIFNRTS
jgi:hypothetical protein